jgi:hypothetical protein
LISIAGRAEWRHVHECVAVEQNIPVSVVLKKMTPRCFGCKTAGSNLASLDRSTWQGRSSLIFPASQPIYLTVI